MNSPFKSHVPIYDGKNSIRCADCGEDITMYSHMVSCTGDQQQTATETLLTERKATHGDWNKQAVTADNIIASMQDTPGWKSLHPTQRQALNLIATKMSRICCGNPDEPDHWDDIAGYAFLGKGGHKEV